MPLGTIKKLVHLTSQSARQENTALIPTRNGVGYGFIEFDGRQIYFDADALSSRFDELRVGDAVEFSADAQLTQASSVQRSAAPRPQSAGSLNAPPTETPAAPSAAPGKPSPYKPAPAARPKKSAADEGIFRVEAKNQCLFVARYQKILPDTWRRVGTLPQIETYASDISTIYREPQLVLVTPERVAVRVYDEQAVDLKRVAELLGNAAEAQARCDKLLLERFPADRIAAELSPLPTW